jgi:fermentation-respiration switch protein FrsA (DUF1100 family)
MMFLPRLRHPARHAMGTLLGLVATALALLLLIWTQQRRLMYFPSDRVFSPDAVGLSNVTSVSFKTEDGLDLDGWFVAAAGQPAWFTVVVFNGNAGNRSFRAPLADALARHGIAVLLFDYRGYGGSPGVPTERGLSRDGRAALAHLMGRPDVDAGHVAYFGESLGSAVATDLAADHPPAALILRSPFRSLVEVGGHHYPFLPVRMLLRDRYEAVHRIADVRCPLLVIAGEHDGIIPPDESRQLYDAARSPKLLKLIPGADHNDEALSFGKEMIDAMVRFLREVETGSGTRHDDRPGPLPVRNHPHRTSAASAMPASTG